MVTKSRFATLLLLCVLGCLAENTFQNNTNNKKVHEPTKQDNSKVTSHNVSTLTSTLNDSVPLVNPLTDIKSKKAEEPWTLEKLRTWALCNACGIFFDYTATLIRRWKRPLKSIQRRLTSICPMIPMFSAEAPDGPEVCLSLIEHFTPTIYYIVQKSPQLQGNAFCGFVLQPFGCEYSDPYLEWTVNVTQSNLTQPSFQGDSHYQLTDNGLREKRYLEDASVDENLSQTSFTPFPAQRQRKLFKILHLSDLHVDLQYKYGAISVCREKVICCRGNSSQPKSDGPFGVGSKPPSRAGFFADSHACGSPLSFLVSALQHITREHPDIGMVYMGGDLVPHDIHGTTKDGNIQVTRQVTDLIRQYFPTIPVIPVLGNHDTHPVNFFSPPGVPSSMNTRWIYNVTLKLWADWVPSTGAETYLKEGYYSKEMPGNLRVIALNTNMCYGFNFWGMYNVNDPGDQLAWLIRQLEDAENKDQRVHIVGHVPPGSPDCNKVWSRNFYDILSRFHRIIRGQFYGHLHKDTLKVFYSPTNPHVPINVAFISPAFTPYKSKNPSYKIFYADVTSNEPTRSPTWDILDYELYVFDLDQANKVADDAIKGLSTSIDKVKASYWLKLYRATTAYDIPDTRPSSLSLLVNRMAQDKSLFDLFHQHYEKALRHQREESTTEAQKEILCDIVRPFAQHEAECERVTLKVDNHLGLRHNDNFLNFNPFTK